MDMKEGIESQPFQQSNVLGFAKNLLNPNGFAIAYLVITLKELDSMRAIYWGRTMV